MIKHELFIQGTPKPQARPRAFKRGSFITVYSPMTEWKERLQLHFSKLEKFPKDTPILLRLSFYFDRPKSHYRSGRNSHILKDDAPRSMISSPDVDNLAKAVMDAMNTASLFADDRQVTVLEVSKNYCSFGFEEEGVNIYIVGDV